jgi:hypothetical protein
LKIALRNTLDRKHWSGVVGGHESYNCKSNIRGPEAPRIHLEAQPQRRLGSRRPDPKHVDVTIGFCEEFALDDDEEVVRVRVLQQETVLNEPM